MHQFFGYTFSGLATSAIYAVAAAGLVLTYTTTGTFNFAHGAVGMIAAFAYWQMRFGWHWPAPIALLAVLLVLAPLFGCAIEVFIMRRLEGTPETTRLVVTISLLVGLLGAALWIWDPNKAYPVRSLFQGDNLSIFGVRVSWNDMITLLIAAVVAVGLRVFLYRARVGVAMRAAVDDRALASLTGARPDIGSMLAWAIGASLAALSGILIAPTLNVSAVPLTLLIVNAYAAAMIGRLRSLPMTFVGALILGMLSEYVPDYFKQWHIGGLYLQGMYLSIPVILLFIVLLVLPNPRLRGRTTARAKEIVPMPVWNGALIFAGGVILTGVILATVVAKADLQTVAAAFGIGIVALSMVPLIGYGGHVSLCQLSLAGIGAVVMAHAGAGGNPIGIVAAIAITGVVGALIALPAVRLSGIYLALATGAFAVIMDNWGFQFPVFSYFGHHFDLFETGSLNVPRPRFLGLHFDSDKAEVILLTVGFVLVAMVVVWVRRSGFGARLLAVKDSPAAAATLGLNLTLLKLEVFALSAAMAGFGGALYGGALQVVSAQQFQLTAGLPILLVVVICGIGTIGGALAATVLVGSPILANLFPSLPQLPLVLFGTAGIGMARNPNGFVLEIKDRWVPVWSRPLVAIGILAAEIVAWVLRLEHAYTNWPYAIVAVAILAVGPLAATPLPQRKPAGDGTVPLEWVGIDRPFTADDVAELDAALALEPMAPPAISESGARVPA
jgi:branched-chain amino acid transport system permease protein